MNHLERDMDIEGSHPKKRKIRYSPYSNIDYSDINQKPQMTKRMVNPLNPIYELDYPDGKYVYGEIEKSKPNIFSPYNSNNEHNLKNADILGSNTGSKNTFFKFHSANFHMTNKDISKSNAGSIMRGIYTTRNINPLDPKYQFPGSKEIGDNFFNKPYGANKKVKIINSTSNIAKGDHLLESKESIKSPIQTPEYNVNDTQIVNSFLNLKKTEVDFEDNESNKVLNPIRSPYNYPTPTFDSDLFKKPVPNYAVVRDEFIISSEDKLKPKGSYVGKLKHRELKAPKISIDNQLPNVKHTFAEKLDNFISI